jgi:hypothetical protein
MSRYWYGDYSQSLEQYETSLQAEHALGRVFLRQHQSHRFPFHLGNREVTSDGTRRITSPGAIVWPTLTMALFRACRSETSRNFLSGESVIVDTGSIVDKRARPAPGSSVQRCSPTTMAPKRKTKARANDDDLDYGNTGDLIDQASDPAPAMSQKRKRRKKSDADDDAGVEPQEKRQAIFKKRCPKIIEERVERVKQQRFVTYAAIWLYSDLFPGFT